MARCPGGPDSVYRTNALSVANGTCRRPGLAARRICRAGTISAVSAVLLASFVLRDNLPMDPEPPGLRITPQEDAQFSTRKLAPLALEGAWELNDSHPEFGGYSALLPLADGKLLAIGDGGWSMTFLPPDTGPDGSSRQSLALTQRSARIFPTMPEVTRSKSDKDSEAATIDPETGVIWVAWETANTITRHRRFGGRADIVTPPAMERWPDNRGTEAMVRLSDGRFIVIREGFGGFDDNGLFGARDHEALLFPGDPILHAGEAARFRFDGPAGFFPVDMAALPDGRVLVLMRKLAWPIPVKVALRLVIADPAEIRPGELWRSHPVATFASDLPIDNFEALAIRPRDDGTVTLWLISDANKAATQRTLLWKLWLDPRRLIIK